MKTEFMETNPVLNLTLNCKKAGYRDCGTLLNKIEEVDKIISKIIATSKKRAPKVML
jgi:hypothetical protein